MLPHASGIYRILNTLNGHIYIGQTQDFQVRWRGHRQRLRCGKHKNAHLQSAWDCYSEDAFSFEIVETVPDLTLLDAREQFYIDTLLPDYNILSIAGTSRGAVLSDRGIANIRAAAQLRSQKPEWREATIKAARERGDDWLENLRAAMRTPEMRALAKVHHTGRKRPPATRAKLCVAQQRRHAREFAAQAVDPSNLKPIYQTILRFIREYAGEHGYGPTQTEINTYIAAPGPWPAQNASRILQRAGYVVADRKGRGQRLMPVELTLPGFVTVGAKPMVR